MRLEAIQRARAADLDRLLTDLEQRLSRLTRSVPSRAAANGMDRVGEAVAAALGDIAEKFRSRARATGSEAERLAGRVGDDALEFGNEALRRLAKEVEQRPLVTLAVAVGVGALAAGLLVRR